MAGVVQNFCLESDHFARVFVASRSIFKQSFDLLTLFDICMADSLAKNPDETFLSTTSDEKMLSAIKLHS